MPDDTIGYAMHSSPSHDAVIRVYDEAGDTRLETHKHTSTAPISFASWYCKRQSLQIGQVFQPSGQ
jgi:hypothetical protein